MSSDAKVRILLDSMVVVGIFSPKKTLNQKDAWKNAIRTLANKVSKNVRFIAPTPVCYELCKWNTHWYSFVENNKSPLFQYSKYSISSQMLWSAARYKIFVRGKENPLAGDDIDKKEKISDMDALIAVYSLQYAYPILTVNQQDFPEKCFRVLGVEVIADNSHQRTTLYLLTPKLSACP